MSVCVAVVLTGEEVEGSETTAAGTDTTARDAAVVLEAKSIGDGLERFGWEAACDVTTASVDNCDELSASVIASVVSPCVAAGATTSVPVGIRYSCLTSVSAPREANERTLLNSLNVTPLPLPLPLLRRYEFAGESGKVSA